MKRILVAGIIGFALTALSADRAWARDIIRRKSDTKALAGDIQSISKTEVTIKVLAKTVKVAANDIVSVDWDDPPPRFKIHQSAEKSGKLDLALTGYEEDLSDAKAGNVKTDVEFFIARTTAKMAMADPTKLDDAIKKMEAFRSAHGNSFRYYEALSYLGRLQMAKKDTVAAKAVFQLMGQAPWKDYQMASQVYAARLQLVENDLSGALAGFDAVIRGTPAGAGPAELSRKYEAMLGKATCLTRQKNYPEAVKVLDEVVKQASAEDSGVQAEAYVRQGDCLWLQGKVKEAVLAYLHVDLLFPAETSLHAEALYHLAKLSPGIDHPERGADARDKLNTDYPNSQWTKKLASGG